MCPDLVASRCNIVEGVGSTDPLVVFVMDKPSREDDASGNPALGRAGVLLRDMVAQVGIASTSTYYTTAVRCRPPKDRIPTATEVANCSNWLVEEVGALEPAAIVLLGRVAEATYAEARAEFTFEHEVYSLPPPDTALRDKRKRDAYLDLLRPLASQLRGDSVPEVKRDVEPWSEGVVDLSSPWLAVDTEGDSLEEDRVDQMVSWQISDGHRAQIGVPQQWVPMDHLWLHNAKFDAPMLGIDLRNLDSWDDTALVAYVLREVPVGLKKVGPKVTGIEMGSIKPLLTRRVSEDRDIKLTKRGLPRGNENVEVFWEPGDTTYTRRTWTSEPRSFSEALAEEPEKAIHYALLDAVVTARLAEVLWPRLVAEPVLHAYYQTVEKPVVPIVAEMEQVGVQVDPRMLNMLDEKLTRLIEEHESLAKLAMDVDEVFKIGSPDQLAARLQQMGVRLRKETNSGKKSVDKATLLEALDALTLDDLQDMQEEEDPAKAAMIAILHYRQYTKLKATYVDRLLEKRDQYGRVHGSFNQTVTDTSRFSSSDPNLQNIPNRSTIGKAIRRAFVAAPGYSLVRTDFSNLEMRIWAHFTNDILLKEVFEMGGDAHSTNSMRMFGSDKELYRKRAKNGVFARIYGASDERFLDTVGIPKSQGKAFLDKLAVDMPALIWWPQWIEEQLQQKGYVQTLFGWRNYYPHYWSPIASESAAAVREAGNMPIQGTASGLVKLFMIGQYQIAQQFDARMVLQVHDETVVEVPKGAVREFAEATRMVGMAVGRQHLSVPLDVEVEVGQSWGEMTKVKFSD